CVVPTVGSMQGCFTTMMMMKDRLPGRDTILFLDPGFPAQHHQAFVLGLRQASIDIYNCRGAALRDALEEALADGRVTAMIYSTPNNPAWTNFTEEELQIIGEAATRHDVVVMEDHAYMGMDFRSPYGRPGQAPFIPTVARYTDNYILFLSASKIFSYAGQRIAIVCMSPQVYDRKYDFYRDFYGVPAYGDAFIFGVLYVASSGVCHSAQYGLAAMLGAAADGKLDFVADCSAYGHRAARAKEIFMRGGFELLYSTDGGGDTPISDGFFFTLKYNGLSGAELQKELMRYGISTISLKSTGSLQQGVRVCVPLLCSDEDFERLDKRVQAFRNDHPVQK
ncbi:MAG: pyridoxal phosphate-dependent aminotransferase, partial [Muribaculaceae bacterium]|nr:pyridoxal phosphate-dependent aminotransferase [Muribaculaceae bacterium]